MPWRKRLMQNQFRDVSAFFAFLREFLLGRKYTLHNRFAPKVAPRSIPPPDIPRAPEYKYSDQYYFKRAVFDSVHPPTIAPIAEGPPIGHPKGKKAPPSAGFKPDAICFPSPPRPGQVWWWDGHCYFENVPDPTPPPPCPKVSFSPPCPDPQPPPKVPESTCPPGHPPCPKETQVEEHPPRCPRPPKH